MNADGPIQLASPSDQVNSGLGEAASAFLRTSLADHVTRTPNARKETCWPNPRCGRWRECSRCARHKAAQVRRRIKQASLEHDLSVLLTLTINPATVAGSQRDQVKELVQIWSRFRVRLIRWRGPAIKFVRVLEFHQSGCPHLHVLMNRCVDRDWIIKAWQRSGGGMIVHIRRCDDCGWRYVGKDVLRTRSILSDCGADATRIFTISRKTRLRKRHSGKKREGVPVAMPAGEHQASPVAGEGA